MDGFRGEGRRNSSVIVVKAHADYLPSFKKGLAAKFSKVIYLVRNPFHAFPAERKRLVAWEDPHRANPAWEVFAAGRITFRDIYGMSSAVPWQNWTSLWAAPKWASTHAKVTEFEQHGMAVLRVRFEDLLADTSRVLTDILTFLGKQALNYLRFIDESEWRVDTAPCFAGKARLVCHGARFGDIQKKLVFILVTISLPSVCLRMGHAFG